MLRIGLQQVDAGGSNGIRVRGACMMRKVCRLILLPLSLGLAGAAALGAAEKADKPELDLSKVPPAATTTVDFARDVKPILSENCVSCHGPKKHEGGLQLGTRQAALAGG